MEDMTLSDTVSSYTQSYMAEVSQIASGLDQNTISDMVLMLRKVREDEGRLFIIGVGGGAGNASHAVNDFRKIAGIEAYTPTDNVSELTARINDDGWDTAFVNWLKKSRLNNNDAVLVFSVGGGDQQKNISVNIVRALEFAKLVGAKVLGIVGHRGGYTSKVADACVIVPMVNQDTVTPHTESFQAVVWHLIVSHPAIKTNEMKWESVL